jgi:diguanylate cyclase (GGDEF)-like protein/PAS domain S-box-containing protein
MASDQGGFELSQLRRLHDLISKVSGSGTLQETLKAVVDGVVEVVGFRVAAINYLHPDGTFEVVVVSGDAEAERTLLGHRLPGGTFDDELAVAEQWGGLYFVPHDRAPAVDWIGWVPDVEAIDSPSAWHPMDALYAPLHSSTGRLVGMLSVDLPSDMRRPGTYQRALLEMFAAQAGIAIENARLTERLAASEKVFRLAFDGAGAGMALVDMSAQDIGRYLQVNQALCQIVGYSAEDLLSRCLEDVTHPADRTPASELPWAGVPAGGLTVHRKEKRYLHAGGDEVWVSETLSVVGADDGAALYGITQVEDIEMIKATRDALTHDVDHDALTGLPNRRTLERHLVEAARAATELGHDGAVLFCDIDCFKDVNDVHGHAVGDCVLVVVAQRLAAGVRTGDIVLRLAGDEFVVVARNIDLIEADAMAERLRALVSAPIVVGAVEVRTSISIGISPLTDRHDPGTVLDLADGAMYRAKLAGRDTQATRT